MAVRIVHKRAGRSRVWGVCMYSTNSAALAKILPFFWRSFARFQCCSTL